MTIEKEISTTGICLTCNEKGHCPMVQTLEVHRGLVYEYGEDYHNIRPDLWDEYGIDEPDIEDGKVEWCPLYDGR